MGGGTLGSHDTTASDTSFAEIWPKQLATVPRAKKTSSFGCCKGGAQNHQLYYPLVI